MKQLVVEEPYQGEKFYQWDADTKRKFRLDADDVEQLEAGDIVYREGTAYSLEEPE